MTTEVVNILKVSMASKVEKKKHKQTKMDNCNIRDTISYASTSLL